MAFSFTSSSRKIVIKKPGGADSYVGSAPTYSAVVLRQCFPTFFSAAAQFWYVKNPTAHH